MKILINELKFLILFSTCLWFNAHQKYKPKTLQLCAKNWISIHFAMKVSRFKLLFYNLISRHISFSIIYVSHCSSMRCMYGIQIIIGVRFDYICFSVFVSIKCSNVEIYLPHPLKSVKKSTEMTKIITKSVSMLW